MTSWGPGRKPNLHSKASSDDQITTRCRENVARRAGHAFLKFVPLRTLTFIAGSRPLMFGKRCCVNGFARYWWRGVIHPCTTLLVLSGVTRAQWHGLLCSRHSRVRHI